MRNQLVKKSKVFLMLLCVGVGGSIATAQEKPTEDLKALKEQMGQVLFNDTALSRNRTMNCASCHEPGRAYTDGRDSPIYKMVSTGADGSHFGDRNAPTAMYGRYHLPFSYDEKRKTYKGGVFWDGRAKDMAKQAGDPPLNQVEMMMPDKKTIIDRLKENPFYEENFKKIYGADIWDDIEKAYAAMGDAIQAYEHTEEFQPFTSKYDKYLRGEYELTSLEDLGRTLFFSNNNVNCKTCHALRTEDSPEEPFTSFEYHNIGVPTNPDLIKFLKFKDDYKDAGLQKNPLVNGDPKQAGKFKTPTLRNVAVTGPYMHNGVFKDLRTVVLFYDKYNNPDRKINPETGKEWGPTDYEETVNLDDLKAQALTDRKVDALVAFMKILTDEKYEHLLEEQDKAADKTPTDAAAKVDAKASNEAPVKVDVNASNIEPAK